MSSFYGEFRKRYGISVEEIEQNCSIIFHYQAREYAATRKVSRKRIKSERSLEDNYSSASQSDQSFSPEVSNAKRKRQPSGVPLPSSSSIHIQRLKKVLNVIYQPNKVGCEWEWGTQFYHIERGILNVMFADAHYKEVINAIWRLEHNFHAWPLTWLIEIENLWKNSILLKHDPNRKHWTAVMAFRIRKKNPCPTQKITGSLRYNIPKRALDIMKSKDKSKISKAEKEDLAKQTGLSEETISNWFKNKRQRESRRQTKLKEDQPDCPVDNMTITLTSDIYHTNQLLDCTSGGCLDCNQNYGFYAPFGYQTEGPYQEAFYQEATDQPQIYYQ